MKSKWIDHKPEALRLRSIGTSMTVIEKNLGIPRSTLSGWFKLVPLSEEQRTKLMKNSKDGWLKARAHAVKAHKGQKLKRMAEAKESAVSTLEKIAITDEVLDLAFAMLYLGEGAKNNTTSLGSSDPKILKFVLAVLRKNYAITPDMVRCELHLRMDQDAQILKAYWSSQLSVPIINFKYVAYDKRTTHRPTYDHYKGVCVIVCGRIAIQRKLINLYNLFCDEVANMEMGD